MVGRIFNCIVVENNHYKNSVGLIKKCYKDSQEYNCLSKQAIQIIKQLKYINKFIFPKIIK